MLGATVVLVLHTAVLFDAAVLLWLGASVAHRLRHAGGGDLESAAAQGAAAAAKDAAGATAGDTTAAARVSATIATDHGAAVIALAVAAITLEVAGARLVRDQRRAD